MLKRFDISCTKNTNYFFKTVINYHAIYIGKLYININKNKQLVNTLTFSNNKFVKNITVQHFLHLCINLACLSVCLYPINVKTAEPIGPKFFVGHLGTLEKVYE